MTAPSKSKCRQYSTEYLSYGFIPAPQNETKPMCLICMDVLSNDHMKPSKLKIHLEKKHIGKKDKPVEYLKKLRDDFQKRKTVPQVFANKMSKMSDGFLASYEISKLLAYVRFNNEGPKKEMLFARSLTTDTKGETIFNKVATYLQENNIPLKNIIACATDGAPSMTGRDKGFIAHLKKAAPEVFCIHCVIHRQHLVAKKMSARLHDALTVVIKVVNHVKSNSLRGRLFLEFCKQNGEEFERLVLHTEVRWLSKGNCLKRFIALWDSIVSFLADTQLGAKLLANKCDVFYLSDIFEKFNSLNKQLQGNDCDLISSKSAIAAFLRKLQLYKNNIRRRAFEQFPCLACVSSDLQDEDLALYGEYLENIHEDM